MAQTAGVLLIGAGLMPVVAVAVFVRFARVGGTALPLTPTRHLVVSGFNRTISDNPS